MLFAITIWVRCFRWSFKKTTNTYHNPYPEYFFSYEKKFCFITAWKVSKYWVLLVRISLYSSWIDENTNQKKLRIGTVFTQCIWLDIEHIKKESSSRFFPFIIPVGTICISDTLGSCPISVKQLLKSNEKVIPCVCLPFLLSPSQRLTLVRSCPTE